MDNQRERLLWIAIRAVVGVSAFSWAAFVLFDFRSRQPCWWIVGAVFGGAATIVTRNAAGRALGRFLAALGYVSVGMIGVVLLRPSGGCVVVQIPFLRSVLPVEKFVAITLLPISLWLFLSSKIARRGSP